MNLSDSTYRINTIDRLRGLSVFLMIIVNFLKEFEWIPPWMKHAQPYGLTFVDFIAPCFFFIIGLTFYISFNNRIEKDGKKAAIRHLYIRGLAIYGTGSLLAAIEMFSPLNEGIDFNILQAIGLSMLAAIPFLTNSFWLKIVVGVIIGVGEHFLLLQINGPEYMLVDARAIGVIGWIGFLLFGLAMGDLFFKCKIKSQYKAYLITCISILFMGVILSLWIPVYHSAATLSYNMITVGVISLLFISLFFITEKKYLKRGYLCDWGSNPLIIFILHFILLIFIRSLPIVTSLDFDSPLIFILLLVIYFGFIQGLVTLLKRKNIIIKI